MSKLETIDINIIKDRILKRGDIRICNNDIFITDYDKNEYSIFDYYLIDKDIFKDNYNMMVIQALELLNIEQNILRLNRSSKKKTDDNNELNKMNSNNFKDDLYEFQVLEQEY